MKVRNLFMIGAMGLMSVAFYSCDGGKTSQLQSQLDSLSRADSLHQEDVKQMADFVNVMSIGLDSISAQEGIIKDLGSREGHLDKKQLKDQLQSLAKTLLNQRERINELEKQVANNNSAYGQRIKKLIAFYKTQLDEKDKQIADLQTQLDEKNTNIAQLTESVNNLTATNTELQTTVDAQSETMAEQKSTIASQDETINTGFVIIGKSSELKSKGIITGGFLTKKKVDVSQLQPGSFSKVDIRNYNDIRLDSSNPKIMTQMPSGSYEIKKNSNGTCTLHIKDATTFWSVSKYLVVRL